MWFDRIYFMCYILRFKHIYHIPCCYWLRLERGSQLGLLMDCVCLNQRERLTFHSLQLSRNVLCKYEIDSECVDERMGWIELIVCSFGRSAWRACNFKEDRLHLWETSHYKVELCYWCNSSRYIKTEGKCPITGEELDLSDLIDVKSTNR